MKRGLALVFLFIFLFSTIGFAELSYYECSNTTVSTHYNYVWVNDTEMNHTTQTWCEYDCSSTGECNPDPLSAENISMFYFLFPITAAVLMYIISTTKPEDWPLHILGLGISLFLILIPFGTLAEALPKHFLRTYQLLVVGTLIIMIYIVLKLMKRGVEHAQRGGGA